MATYKKLDVQLTSSLTEDLYYISREINGIKKTTPTDAKFSNENGSILVYGTFDNSIIFAAAYHPEYIHSAYINDNGSFSSEYVFGDETALIYKKMSPRIISSPWDTQTFQCGVRTKVIRGYLPDEYFTQISSLMGKKQKTTLLNNI